MGGEQLISIFGAWGVAIIFVLIALKWMADELKKTKEECKEKDKALQELQEKRFGDAVESLGATRDALLTLQSASDMMKEVRDHSQNEPAFRKRVEDFMAQDEHFRKELQERLQTLHDVIHSFVDDLKRRSP